MRSAAGHVARVLFVARRVRHHELALGGGEVAVGHVDGDALLALRRQAIHQQGEIDGPALAAVAPAVRFQRRQLVIENQLGIEQQPADERALAVVHATAGQEAQGGHGRLFPQIGLNVRRRHQK